MKKDLRTISFTGVLCLTVIVMAGCIMDEAFRETKKAKGIVAIVYADLTKSINEEIAAKQKENIGQLFKKLPVSTKFFLLSIDRGTNKPNLYEFIPDLPAVKVESDKKKLEKAKADNEKAKETTEAQKLNSALNSYHDSIVGQNGSVSCISNKLNSLLDLVLSKKTSYSDHEIRIFFYSDMIEDCELAFDGKPLNLQRTGSAEDDTRHLQEIRNRINQYFAQAGTEKSLQAPGTRIYIVQTAQDDKQNPETLKTIWKSFFEKLGFAPEDISWTNSNEEYFWKL